MVKEENLSLIFPISNDKVQPCDYLGFIKHG